MTVCTKMPNRSHVFTREIATYDGSQASHWIPLEKHYKNHPQFVPIRRLEDPQNQDKIGISNGVNRDKNVIDRDWSITIVNDRDKSVTIVNDRYLYFHDREHIVIVSWSYRYVVQYQSVIPINKRWTEQVTKTDCHLLLHQWPQYIYRYVYTYYV